MDVGSIIEGASNYKGFPSAHQSRGLAAMSDARSEARAHWGRWVRVHHSRWSEIPPNPLGDVIVTLPNLFLKNSNFTNPIVMYTILGCPTSIVIFPKIKRINTYISMWTPYFALLAQILKILCRKGTRQLNWDGGSIDYQIQPSAFQRLKKIQL